MPTEDQDLGRPARRREDAEGGRRHADRGRRRRQVAAALLLDAPRGAHRRQGRRSRRRCAARTAASSGETFEKSGELFKQLVDLQPFQNGFLGFKNPQAVGYFGDGKAAMTLAISTIYHTQRALAADKVGLADDKIGWFDFPAVPGGKGDADRHARRHHRLAHHQGLAEGGDRLPQVLHLQGRADAGWPPAISSFPSSRARRTASTAPS